MFLDAFGGEDPQRDTSRALLETAGDGDLDGVTNSGVRQEIVHMRSRGLGWSDTAPAVRAAAALVADVLPVTHADVLAACDLIEHQDA